METVTDKNKTASNRPNSEERTLGRLKNEDVGFDWKSFAINATLTAAQGAFFMLGSLAAKSAVDRIRPQTSKDFLVDGNSNKKQLVGHA
jgi:hypothetical protein